MKLSRSVGRTALASIAIAVVGVTGGCAAATAPADSVASQASPPAAPGDLTATDVDAWLDGLLPAALERGGIAGAAVSVVHDGEILTARGYGSADTGTGDAPRRAVDPEDTLFRVASISKLFSATSVMQLVESGDLDLDADVNDYLDFDLADPLGPITLRTLLTHTAGFEERASGVIEPDGVDVDLRRYITEDQPDVVYPPGEVPAYSNYGNSLAGYVVERVSGIPFADYVQRRILEPAGMMSSSFAQPLPDDLAPRVATGYADVSQPGVDFERVGAAPAGGLSASATDMARFMLAHLDDLPDGQSILAPDTLKLMHEPALDSDALGTLAGGDRMTLGFFQEDRNEHRILGHLGDTTTFHSALEIFPDDATGVFISMNSTGYAGEAGPIREALMSGFADRYFPAADGAGTAVGVTAAAADTAAGDSGAAGDTAATGPDHARTAAGSYEVSRSFHSTFVSLIGLAGQTRVTPRADGTILVDALPGDTRPAVFEETDPWMWTEVGGDRTIAMRGDGDKVTAIGYDPAFTLLRAEGARDPALTVPLTIGALAILLIALLAPVVGRLARRYLGAPRSSPAGPRPVRVVTWAGVAAALAAAVGWAVTYQGVLASEYVPDTVIRGIQVLQLVGAVALVPAVISVVTAVRERTGWTRIAGRVLIVAALAELTWFAVVFKLLAPSIAY